MNIDKERQQKALTVTRDLIHSGESQRRQMRLERGIADLRNHRFQVLHNSEFVDALIDYLQGEYQDKPTDAIRGILEKIGASACSNDKELRERAVFILSVVAEKILQSSNYLEFLELVSLHLVNWLQNETEYLAGFHFICLQLQSMLQNMLRLGLWYQAENLIIILSQIQKGVISKPEIMRKVICQIHADLADEDFLRKLVDVVLDDKEDRRDIAQCLLTQFGSKAAAVLVQALIDCPDKEKRYNLIEFIPSAGKAVVPICDYCLKQDPPWYVIRNLIIIISRLGDQSLYDMVRPHLAHKDIRVQMQILNCITRLGGANMRDRLIEALNVVSDELKPQVVMQLGNLGGREVGKALCQLLETRDRFAVHVRDELLITIFNKIKFEPTPSTLKAVKGFVTQRRQQVDEGDRVLLAAQDALMSIELKLSPGAEAIPAQPQPPAPTAADLLVVPVATEEEFDQLLREKMAAIINAKKRHPAVVPAPAGDEPATTAKAQGPKPPPAGKKALKTHPAQQALQAAQAASHPAPQASMQRHLPAERPFPADSPFEEEGDSPEMKRHRQVWEKFYAILDDEERRAFRGALKFRRYQPGEMVMARGNLQPSLHLFDTGTVRLARNKAGEESAFIDLNGGDMIGSDIFLSGEPWNLSLYAGKELTAHVYNLENLLETHLGLPELAEKVLGYCACHDILPGMLKIADHPEDMVSERARLHGPQGDKEEAMILHKLPAGLSALLPVAATGKLDRMLRQRFDLTLSLPSGASPVVRATVIGVVRTLAEPNRATVFLQFQEPLQDSRYLCREIAYNHS